MERESFMVWKVKKFLVIKISIDMDANRYINKIREIIFNEFNFLTKMGYSYSNYTIQEKMHLHLLEIIYKSSEYKKEVAISASISLNSNNEFYITSSISNIPYKDVNDFISFDIYLKKILHIETNTTIKLYKMESDIELIDGQVRAYADLFKKEGSSLIASHKKFSGLYPEWT